MGGASGSDKSLLDRLSALKGGNAGISLDGSSNELNASVASIETAKPISREDALAARLRSLRNTPEREEPPKPNVKEQLRPSAGAQPTRAEESRDGTAGSPSVTNPINPSAVSQYMDTVAAGAVAGDDEPLFETDDRTLEELLEDEESASEAPWAFDPRAEAKRVEALMQELSQTSITHSRPIHGARKDGNAASDDSEDEQMSREVDSLVSQALEEAKLNPDEDREAAATHDPVKVRGDPEETPSFSLPSVPSTLSTPATKGVDVAETEDGPHLSLPSVPSTMKDPASASPGQSRKPGDFDSDIATRMAALRGLRAAQDEDNPIGLPSVPTFKPSDRAMRTQQKKGPSSKTGYTDEDMDGWCTVCLEDATLRCLGCDEDVYCSRCWREMHIGPASAYDDITHKAVQFVKDRKKKEKKVALGAS